MEMFNLNHRKKAPTKSLYVDPDANRKWAEQFTLMQHTKRMSAVIRYMPTLTIFTAVTSFLFKYTKSPLPEDITKLFEFLAYILLILSVAMPISYSKKTRDYRAASRSFHDFDILEIIIILMFLTSFIFIDRILRKDYIRISYILLIGGGLTLISEDAIVSLNVTRTLNKIRKKTNSENHSLK